MLSVPRARRGGDPVVGVAPRRARRAPAAAVGAALVVGAATLLPWTVSGTVGRNAFATVGSAVRLGVVPDGAGALVALAWDAPLFLALGALLAQLTGRARTALVLATSTAVIAGSLALAVLRSPVVAGPGVPLALAGAAVAVGAAVVAWRQGPA